MKRRKKRGKEDCELRTTDAVMAGLHCFFFVNIVYNTMYYMELLIGN